MITLSAAKDWLKGALQLHTWLNSFVSSLALLLQCYVLQFVGSIELISLLGRVGGGKKHKHGIADSGSSEMNIN